MPSRRALLLLLLVVVPSTSSATKKTPWCAVSSDFTPPPGIKQGGEGVAVFRFTARVDTQSLEVQVFGDAKLEAQPPVITATFKDIAKGASVELKVPVRLKAEWGSLGVNLKTSDKERGKGMANFSVVVGSVPPPPQ